MYGRIRLRQAAGRRTSRDRTLLGTERGVAMPTTTSIEAPDANPGAPGRWASPAWMTERRKPLRCRAVWQTGSAAARSPPTRVGGFYWGGTGLHSNRSPGCKSGGTGPLGEPGLDDRAAEAAALSGGVANGIRRRAEPPDSRRGLLLGRHGAPFQIEAPDANPGAPGRWASPAWRCRRKVAPVSDRWAVS